MMMNSDDGNTRDKTEFVYILFEEYSRVHYRDVQVLVKHHAMPWWAVCPTSKIGPISETSLIPPSEIGYD